MGGATRAHEESRQTFYTRHERFIQGLACLLNIHPSLKISPWSSQSSPMEILGKIGRIHAHQGHFGNMSL
jgi:hypothetical protein